MNTNKNNLTVYNTLSRKKELFKPINDPYVGLYVCGPTVYGDAHLGHARPAITFDILFKYLKHIDYKVRYVRNITDVGHLENDSDSGEDKIQKKARLEQLEPMEISHYYTERYHKNMAQLNVETPSIEPRASGHIIEQIELIQKIIDAGFAYEANGSIYFDVTKYNSSNNYGILSGRNIDDLLSNTRKLDGQDEKRNALDFALWKKANPEHIMKWNSPWSLGFPGWHLECTSMGSKYLGQQFDIHGGGLDLMFPHHECEIAQANAAFGKNPAKYWIHNNMITINGQKMGKSLNNFITLDEIFSGNHALLEKAYSPMTIRFFILQAHYRSTLDFSNEAIQSAEKGYAKLINGFENIKNIVPSDKSTFNVEEISKKCYNAINDDLNTPIVIATLFDGLRLINLALEKKETLTKSDIDALHLTYKTFLFDIMGLNSNEDKNDKDILDKVINVVLSIRTEARNNKDWKTSDIIRDELLKAGISIKDSKDSTTWNLS